MFVTKSTVTSKWWHGLAAACWSQYDMIRQKSLTWTRKLSI